MKKCKICDEEFTIKGLKCKKCIAQYYRDYQTKNAKDIADKKKKYYSEVILERRRIRDDKRYLLKYGMTKDELRKESKEKEKAYRKAYYIKNKETISKKSTEYTKKNRSIINKKLKEKIQNNPSFKTATNLRVLIYAHLKKQLTKKCNSSFNLTGCSIHELMAHLESKWLPGMSWDNHSLDGWHIDHIKPCSKFDLTIKEEQYKCFHFSNLQPLWAFDNISKGNR